MRVMSFGEAAIGFTVAKFKTPDAVPGIDPNDQSRVCQIGQAAKDRRVVETVHGQSFTNLGLCAGNVLHRQTLQEVDSRNRPA